MKNKSPQQRIDLTLPSNYQEEHREGMDDVLGQLANLSGKMGDPILDNFFGELAQMRDDNPDESLFEQGQEKWCPDTSAQNKSK